MDQLQNIISDIESESCVLIIGHDMVDFGDKSFFQVLCDEIQKDQQYNQLLDISPQYIFAHEELLQLKPSAKETLLLRYMERFYAKQSQFDEPFRKISQIPFHLIVSFLPDTRIRKIFEEQELEFQYSHYPREVNPQPVDKPSKKTPLIYNLLGDFGEMDAIITFDHLFVYLSGIMGKRELPQSIQESFKKAKTFIFLGVHFEKWYVQLLLRIITTMEKREKYTFLKNAGNNEFCTFIARRLELDFVEAEPVNFLDQLYEECRNRNMLKKTRKDKRAKVFLSYNHNDKEMAYKIEKYLGNENIEVIIDEKSMSGGQKIEDFIDKIKEVDCVLTVISRHSLFSAWVSREIITTLQKTDKYFLPCILDDTFRDPHFVQTAEAFVDEKMKSIAEQIAQRGRGHMDDLFNERKDWSEYIHNLPLVLNELNRRKYLSLKPDDFDRTILSVVDDILKNK